MAAAKIKKGDKVVVLSGKDKGRHGEVTRVMPKDGKVLVSGINVHARHAKPTRRKLRRLGPRRRTPERVATDRRDFPVEVKKRNWIDDPDAVQP